ncbi:MAG TPA: SpoIID/LytB domain-containing protein [Candidatus Babeliales bacterium]|nr:SpoIID/LytB domain-containing protein [Candidatus Babeliales bacterium]
MILDFRKNGLFTFFLLFFFSSMYLRGYHVRVLLYEQHCSDLKPVVLSAHNGIFIVDPDKHQKSKKSYQKLVITYQGKKLFVNGKECPLLKFFCQSVRGSIVFRDNEYAGRFSVEIYQKKIYVINIIDLEDYIYAVLKTESWPGWPLEINKVQAIVSRTYALAKILEAQKTGLPYHIKNTNAHQTYEGLHTSYNLQQAVDATQNIFIAHKKKPIVAMFDSCCGGIIPHRMKGFNFRHAPYLARNYACTFCSNAKVFNWSVYYSDSELTEISRALGKPCKKIVKAYIDGCDGAGLVRRFIIKSDKGNVALIGNNVYAQLKKIKSNLFNVTQDRNGYLFRGKGYGHHVGLCQWGARELVSRGWLVEQIIDFYYPKTTLMKLKSNSILS